MSLLSQIQSGRQVVPRRVMLYGTQGVGKTQWAASAPQPIFVQTEDGLAGIECDRFPLAKSFGEIIQALSELYTGEHHYKTVVIDSADWLEQLIWADVCRKRGVESIEDIGYGKGYVFALKPWRDVLDGLDALRNERGMHVILIAHSRIERFESPEVESFDRYVARLNRHACSLIQEWADEVLFATYRVHTRMTDEGFGRKKARGIGTGERIIRTTERPAHIAKNRLNLPEELPLDWNEYAKFLPH